MLELIKIIYITLLNSKKNLIFIITAIVIYLFSIFYTVTLNNRTHSMPQYLWISQNRNFKLNRNDLVVFYSNSNNKGLPINDKVAKQISGMPGDKIKLSNNWVYINNNKIVGINESFAFFGDIHPIESQIIPPKCYFLRGMAFDSYDSRYKEFGLVCESQIIGKSWAFF